MRVAVCYLCAAFYRLPFFELLGEGEGIDLHVIAGQPESRSGVRVLEGGECFGYHPVRNRFFLENRMVFGWQSGIVGELDRLQPDAVIVQATPRVLSNFGVVRWARARGVPIWGWGMGPMPGRPAGIAARLQDKFVSSFVRQLTGVICYGTFSRDYYQRLGVKSSALAIAYNASDTNEALRLQAEIGPAIDWRGEWLCSQGLEEGVLTILFVGRLVRRKQIDQLIAAVSSLNNPVQLIIVGDGPDRGRLEQLANDGGGRICFTGHLEGVDLARAFLGSDLFVLPSMGGLAIHQAMSYGMPVIASYGDGTEIDLIENGVNGYLFHEGDFSAMTGKMMWFAAHRDEIPAFGRASRDRACRLFSINAMKDSFRQVLGV